MLEYAAIKKKNLFHFRWTFRWFPVRGYYCFRVCRDRARSLPGVRVTDVSPAAFIESSVCVPPPRRCPRCQLCHTSSVHVCLGPIPGAVFSSLASATPVQCLQSLNKQNPPELRFATAVNLCLIWRQELASLVVFSPFTEVLFSILITFRHFSRKALAHCRQAYY